LPLTPPDDDVEGYSPVADDAAFRENTDSQFSTVFLSHTHKDESVIRARVLPTLKPFFASVFLMNISMVRAERPGPEIVVAYKRRILKALSRSAWIVVAVSAAAASSEWVGFEFAWALRNHNHRRILALILDEAGKRALSPVLRFVRTVPAFETSKDTELAISRALQRSGAREPVI